MSDDMIFNGPVEFEMKVMVVNDETNQSGKVTIGMGLFKYPSKESVAERIKKFESEELTGALQGFRLMTKEEVWNTEMYEKTGERFAMAGGKDWDEISPVLS